MSLIYCPECGHEVSQNAVACPNCGFPLSARPPVVDEIVRPAAPAAIVTPARREGAAPWVYAVSVLAGVLLFVLLFLLFRWGTGESNVNVAVNANRRPAESNREARNTNIPTTSEPQTAAGTQNSVPSVPLPPLSAGPPPGTSDRGTVAIRAQIVTPKGATQPARAARFYLLDKDIETVLSEAGVEPIEGNTLSASLGLAAVYPDRYPQFRQAAARALAAHTKYSGTTDTSGSARLANIAPKEYYLFAITRVGNGFALWNAPVSVAPGDNNLDLSPASVTEIES